MAKAVEIEFLMRDKNLSAGINKARNKVDETTVSAERLGRKLDKVNAKGRDRSLQEGMDRAKIKTAEAKTEVGALNLSLDKAAKLLAGMGAAVSLQGFAREMANVRGEFQKLEVAFNTMLGSKEKADELMQQLVETAATTPFDLQGVANGAKQLLAYGDDVENVNEDLVRLGNIAAGLSIPLGDIVYLYGTTMTQGRLYTQDLNQFTGRGIPMIKELAKQFGVAENKVKELVEAGKVGFPEVQKVIQSLTDEGGMFYNLMEEQSKTISGQISNIEDAIDNMFNEMGKASEGVINTALSGMSYLVENYEKVGEILVGLVTTYGAYKAAVMAVTAVTRLQAAGVAALTVAERIHYGVLVLTTAAQKALNAAMLTNPYVLAAVAVAGLAAAMWAFNDSATESEKAQDRFNKRQEEAQRKEEEHKQKIEALMGSVQDIARTDLQRRESLADLRAEYPKIFEQYDIESIKLADILSLKQQIAAEDAKRTQQNSNQELADMEKEIASLEKYLKTMSGQQGLDGTVKKLKELRADRDILLEEKGKGISEQFISTFKDIDIQEFDHYISELEKRIQGKGDGKVKLRLPIDVEGTLSDEAIYSVRDIKNLIETAKSTQKSRSEKKSTYKEAYETAKKEWEEAKKEFAKIENNKSKYSTEQYDKAKKRVKETKESYENLGGVTDKTLNKRAEEQKKTQKELDKEILSLRQENTTNEVALMEEGTEKKVAQIKADYERQAAEIEKRAKELAEKNRKAGVTDVDEKSGLTAEQQAEIDKANDLNEQNREKQTREAYRAELESMRDYLKEYGTYQQQRLAIAEEYAEKIRKAQAAGDTWEVKRLERQRETELAGTDAKRLAMDVDWSQTFSSVGVVLQDIARETLAKIEAYMDTDEFKNLNPESKRSYADFASQLKAGGAGQSTSAFNFSIWGEVAEDVRRYQESVRSLQAAENSHAIAVENLEKAQKKLADATTDTEKEMAQAGVDMAQAAVDATGRDVDDATAENTEANRRLNDSTEKASNGLDNFANYVGQMADGSLSGFANGVSKLVTSLQKGSNGVGKSLNELGSSIGGIVGAILSIIDSLGDNPAQFLDDLLENVELAVTQILSDLPNIATSVVEGVAGIVGGIGSGLGSLFGISNGSNAKWVTEITEELTDSNDRLKDSIDKLTDEIEDAYGGADAISAAKEALENQETINEQTMEVLKAQMSYHKNHHSNAYYWNLTDDDYASLNETLAEYARKSGLTASSVNSLEDIYGLTPEEMDYIRTWNTEMWAKMLEQGKYDKSEYWEAYADLAGELEEISDTLKETLTQTTFDSVRESFLDTLMDMDAGIDDLADDFSEKMMKAVLNAKMADLMDDQLEEFYGKWAEYMESDNTLTSDELAELQDMWNDLVDQGLALRDEVAAVTGYTGDSSTTQSGNSGSYTALTQEQGTKLEGTFTSGLMHWSSMDTNLEVVTAKMSLAESHLAQIAEYTGECRDSLATMLEDVKKIIRDGLKVK